MNIKKIVIISIVFCVIIISQFSCKKYEEGPSFSLRSKTHRLVGNYKLEKYYVNEIDSTSMLKNDTTKFYLSFINEWNKADKSKLFSFQLVGEHNLFLYYGDWEFDSNKRQLVWIYEDKSEQNLINFHLLHSIEVADKHPMKEISWDIKKLTKNQLIIETNPNGFEYRMELNKVEQY